MTLRRGEGDHKVNRTTEKVILPSHVTLKTCGLKHIARSVFMPSTSNIENESATQLFFRPRHMHTSQPTHLHRLALYQFIFELFQAG